MSVEKLINLIMSGNSSPTPSIKIEEYIDKFSKRELNTLYIMNMVIYIPKLKMGLSDFE